MITSGMDERDERKRTSDDASKRFRRHQNWGCTTAPGRVWRKPTYWPRGVRCIGGMTLVRALVRNLRTCPAMPRERYKQRNCEAESTDASGRGGLLRSSDEAGQCPWSEGGRSPTLGVSQLATGGAPILDGRRQPSFGGTSRMTRECQVRICERLGVKLPGPTRQRCGNVGT